MTTSLGHQESGNASSHPNCAHQPAPVTQLPSVQQKQSMATTMAKLTHQNQELTRVINQRQCHERCVEGLAQSQEVREVENVKRENYSRGTALRRVPHLEKEMEGHGQDEGKYEKDESCR